jgi:hypothetical protein
MRAILFMSVLASGLAAAPAWAAQAPAAAVLKAADFKNHIDTFNQNDRELYVQHVPNAAAWEFLKDNVPLLECPDKELEETYYFRWWTYRKHIKQTPDGFIITEFLPQVGWSGKHNSINCAAGHHLYEGRWLRDPKYLDDYAVFWFRKGGDPRRYSFWAADALWARYTVTGNADLPKDLLPDLVRNFEAWEKARGDPSGLFWQTDDRDGGEVSIGGSGFRATINSYMYGDALALARIAELAGQGDLAARFRKRAAEIKQLVQEKLWDKDAQFFKVLPTSANCTATRRGTSTCPTRPAPSRGSRSWTRKGSTRRSAPRRPSSGTPGSPFPTRATSASGTAPVGLTPQPSRSPRWPTSSTTISRMRSAARTTSTS